jgi:hypothetical protein
MDDDFDGGAGLDTARTVPTGRKPPDLCIWPYACTTISKHIPAAAN